MYHKTPVHIHKYHNNSKHSLMDGHGKDKIYLVAPVYLLKKFI